MQQYQSQKGYNTLELISEYSIWGAQELIQALLGAFWVGMVCAMFMYMYTYQQYYRKGVIEGDKSYYLTYLDLKAMSRRIATTYIMFFIGSYAAAYSPEFWNTVIKGCFLGAIMWPPIYWHYSDENEYKFEYRDKKC
eukprot:403332019